MCSISEALAGAELLLVDLLAAGDDDVEAAHEVARARVEPLDLAGQPLELRAQLAAVRMLVLERARAMPAERVADRGQARPLERADRLGELVERLEQRLHPLGGLGDRVRVAVAAQLACGAGEARVELAADRAPGVQLVEDADTAAVSSSRSNSSRTRAATAVGLEPQAEVAVLEVERAHDPPVALGALDDRVLEHAVRSEDGLGGDPARLSAPKASVEPRAATPRNSLSVRSIRTSATQAPGRVTSRVASPRHRTDSAVRR